jgi:hypothetical protein
VSISAPTGTLGIGMVLTAQPAQFDQYADTFTYQWQRCDTAGANCAPISGANNASYTIVDADAEHTIKVAETAHGAGGASQPSTSRATDKVQGNAEVAITAVPSGNSPAGNIVFATSGYVTNTTCSYDGAAFTACASPLYLNVGNTTTNHTLAVKASNPVNSQTKTATWVSTSNYVVQGYDTGGYVDWGFYCDPGGDCYEHYGYSYTHVDTSYWNYNGYWANN